jgi:hypothetical protein
MSVCLPVGQCLAPRRTEAIDVYRVAEIGLTALLVLACAIPLALNLVDPDLWGHVRYGEDWLDAGALPRTATHTFTAEGHPWINHENLAELLFAAGFRNLSIQGMLVLKCLGGLALLGSMAWFAGRQGVSRMTAWALMLLVAENLQAFFPMRPQLLSFALLGAVLACLECGFRQWHAERRIDFRWLLPLPPLFAVWANAHGVFLAGLAIVGALLAGRMVELAWSRGRDGWPDQLRLALVGLACVAATLLNPYGWNLHLWLKYSLTMPRPEITEWAAPAPGDPVFGRYLLLLATAAASWWGTRRQRDWVQIAVFCLVAWQAFLHLRNIALVAILAGYWLPPHFASAASRLRPQGLALPTALPSRPLRRLLAAVVLGGVALQSFALSDRLREFPVARDQYPVDALQYMVDRGLQGKLVVCFNWAQYALAALAPHSQVQFDGRFDTCYPREVMDLHFDFLLGEHGGNRFRGAASGPIDPRKTLVHGQPDLILLDRSYPIPVQVLEQEAAREQPAWTLLYRDPTAELWGRASRYDDPQSPCYLPVAERSLHTRLAPARFDFPALPDYQLWHARQRRDAAPANAVDPAAGVAAGRVD